MIPGTINRQWVVSAELDVANGPLDGGRLAVDREAVGGIGGQADKVRREKLRHSGFE